MIPETIGYFWQQRSRQKNSSSFARSGIVTSYPRE